MHYINFSHASNYNHFDQHIESVGYSLAVIPYLDTMDPEMANGLYINLGISYKNIKEYQKSIDAYEKALEIDHNYVRALAGMGWVNSKTKNYTAAIDYFEKAIRFKPDDNFSKIRLQIARASLENPDLDLEDFRNKRIDANETLRVAYDYMQNRRFEEAIFEIKNAVNLNPFDPLPYVYLGYCYYNLKNYESAAVELQHAISLDPFNAETAKSYACTLNKLGRLDEAFKVVREISAKIPANRAFKELLQDIKSRNTNKLRF